MVQQQDVQKKLMEFEQKRAALLNVSGQRQNIQFQLDALKRAKDELQKTKEKKVYKAVGNILILSEVKDVTKEVGEQVDTLEVRVKSLQKQEDSLVDSMNKMKSEIEETMKSLKPSAEESPVVQ